MPSSDAADTDALRALARALAPYLIDELRDRGLIAGQTAAGSLDPDYDAATAAVYVEDLSRDVIERAVELFSALAEPPHRIDSQALAARVGAVNPRDLSGILTTPLKRRADALGLPRPWIDDESRGRTAWRERAPGMAERVRQALETASRINRAHDTSLADQHSHVGEYRPEPSAVFAWSAQSVARISPDARGSSVLRDSRPGSRAVIYQVDPPLGIVALFDVTGDPEPHEQWRWTADGAFHILDPPVTQEELVVDDRLRPIFTNLTSRRRLPLPAQTALASLIAHQYPDHQLPLFRAPT